MPIKLVRIVRKKRNKTLTLTAGQYTQDETIADELRTMRAADFEQKVDVVWSLILGHYLSKGKGYVHARENRVRKGYVDIYTKQWVRRPGHQDRVQCPFLITQCKRQKRQWRDEAWDEGRHQIDKYLKGLKRKKSWKHPSYGIVAAGKYVRFYEWDTKEEELLLYNDERKYHIINDAQEIENLLLYIRDRHKK